MVDYSKDAIVKRITGQAMQANIDDIELEAKRYVAKLVEEFDEEYYGDREVPELGEVFDPKVHIPAFREVAKMILSPVPQDQQPQNDPNRFGG